MGSDRVPLADGGVKSKRIHFLSDFEKYGPSHEPYLYRCQRCGDEILGESACYNHREGLLSECRLTRLSNWLGNRRGA